MARNQEKRFAIHCLTINRLTTDTMTDSVTNLILVSLYIKLQWVTTTSKGRSRSPEPTQNV